MDVLLDTNQALMPSCMMTLPPRMHPIIVAKLSDKSPFALSQEKALLILHHVLRRFILVHIARHVCRWAARAVP